MKWKIPVTKKKKEVNNLFLIVINLFMMSEYKLKKINLIIIKIPIRCNYKYPIIWQTVVVFFVIKRQLLFSAINFVFKIISVYLECEMGLGVFNLILPLYYFLCVINISEIIIHSRVIYSELHFWLISFFNLT